MPMCFARRSCSTRRHRRVPHATIAGDTGDSGCAHRRQAVPRDTHLLHERSASAVARPVHWNSIRTRTPGPRPPGRIARRLRPGTSGRVWNGFGRRSPPGFRIGSPDAARVRPPRRRRPRWTRVESLRPGRREWLRSEAREDHGASKIAARPGPKHYLSRACLAFPLRTPGGCCWRSPGRPARAPRPRRFRQPTIRDAAGGAPDRPGGHPPLIMWGRRRNECCIAPRTGVSSGGEGAIFSIPSRRSRKRPRCRHVSSVTASSLWAGVGAFRWDAIVSSVSGEGGVRHNGNAGPRGRAEPARLSKAGLRPRSDYSLEGEPMRPTPQPPRSCATG
jgi:hypothetical protein